MVKAAQGNPQLFLMTEMILHNNPEIISERPWLENSLEFTDVMMFSCSVCCSPVVVHQTNFNLPPAEVQAEMYAITRSVFGAKYLFPRCLRFCPTCQLRCLRGLTPSDETALVNFQHDFTRFPLTQSLQLHPHHVSGNYAIFDQEEAIRIKMHIYSNLRKICPEFLPSIASKVPGIGQHSEVPDRVLGGPHQPGPYVSIHNLSQDEIRQVSKSEV